MCKRWRHYLTGGRGLGPPPAFPLLSVGLLALVVLFCLVTPREGGGPLYRLGRNLLVERSPERRPRTFPRISFLRVPLTVDALWQSSRSGGFSLPAGSQSLRQPGPPGPRRPSGVSIRRGGLQVLKGLVLQDRRYPDSIFSASAAAWYSASFPLNFVPSPLLSSIAALVFRTTQFTSWRKALASTGPAMRCNARPWAAVHATLPPCFWPLLILKVATSGRTRRSIC